MKFRRTCKEFTEIREEWDSVLRDSGFIDIEASKPLVNNPFESEKSVITLEAKRQYFRLLSQRLASEVIENEAERLIMELTADGKTIREISRHLKSLKLRKSNKDTIRYIRRRYEDKWEIRNWSPEEMVSRKIKTQAT